MLLNNIVMANKKLLSTKAIKKYIEVTFYLDCFLSETILLNNLKAFFNSIDKNIEFIAIMTKIETDSNTYTLENKTIIDLNKESDVAKYIKDVIAKFNDKFSEANYNPKSVIKIYFCYKEVTKDNYINFNKKRNRHINSLLIQK